LAEIRLGSTQLAEVVRLPVDLLDRVGERLDGHSLDIVFTRLRLDLPDIDRQDDESHLDRRFELPTARSFGLQGTARRTDAAVGAGAASPALPCRADLLMLDGRALPVRLVPDSASGTSASITACASLDLAVGSHRLTASTGRVSGWDLDQVVLSTDARGHPADVGVRSAPARPAPAVRTTATSAAAVDAKVSSDGTPFWFVLGQSASEGWSLEAEGASVGPRTLVDGYANGWALTPDDRGTVTVRLQWGPQRLVWVSMAASAVAVLACAVILLRRRPGDVPTLGAAPILRWPTALGPRPWTTVAGTTAAVAGVALLVATPVVAAVAAAVTIAAGLVPRGRIVLLAVAPMALVASRVLTERPSLAWLALAAVGADLLLSRGEISPSPG